MEIILSKLLPVFLYPLGLSTLILILIGLFSRPGNKWGRLLLGFALLILIPPSLTVVADALICSLEQKYPVRAIREYPRAGAIVVLAGGVADVRPETLKPRPGNNFDRLYQGYELFKSQKARLIVVTGGHIGWQVRKDSATEAELMAALLHSFGVSKENILVEPNSRNTHENARNTARILLPSGIQRVLLVTSALHMPRAVACFEDTGLEVIPAPADQLHDVQGKTTLLDFLPDANALAASSNALKEYLGLLYYTLRGWA